MRHCDFLVQWRIFYSQHIPSLHQRYNLTMLTSRNQNVVQNQNGWKFHLAQGGSDEYRCAQVDDYSSLARSRFLWQEPTTLTLRCRVSENSLPGTWGFGFWNDPFPSYLGTSSFALGLGGRLPALPNCAWFFYASPENYLSFQSETCRALPGNGFLAQTFSAPRIPSALLTPGALGLPFFVAKPISRWLRANVAAKLISEDAKRLEVDATQWHIYRLQWGQNRVGFAIDEETVFITETSPQGPLGLVIWIDNQFAAWRPDGTLGAGTLPNPPAWMEVDDMKVG